ncbi:hypothetical protein BJ982_005383 [Sphaerisporangium siamense]|uniref:Uncharacterized protein n=1 Tax=Sphaerisporangium siamense TaxID=795645 RepID=A0A7W7GCT4_9ACTN|nr:hypothetical protein [Sphaerisporangium siamense]
MRTGKPMARAAIDGHGVSKPTREGTGSHSTEVVIGHARRRPMVDPAAAPITVPQAVPSPIRHAANNRRIVVEPATRSRTRRDREPPDRPAPASAQPRATTSAARTNRRQDEPPPAGRFLESPFDVGGRGVTQPVVEPGPLDRRCPMEGRVDDQLLRLQVKAQVSRHLRRDEHPFHVGTGGLGDGRGNARPRERPLLGGRSGVVDDRHSVDVHVLSCNDYDRILVIRRPRVSREITEQRSVTDETRRRDVFQVR